MLIQRRQEVYDNAIDSNIVDFLANNNNSNSFKFNQQITEQTGNDNTRDVEVMVHLKYLYNFW